MQTPAPLILHNATLIDATGADPRRSTSIELREGRISRVFPADKLPASPDATVIDLAGHFLLPGLTDAHVHFALTEPNGAPTQPWAEWAARVSAFIGQTLDQGFTTVRDAGALDPAWARVVERGLVRGPRILPSGAFISQTGGHGDWRPSHQDEHAIHSVPGLFSGYVLTDGPDEVRRAARDQLRRGATQIKVMASGGVASPTDPIDATRTNAELFGMSDEIGTIEEGKLADLVAFDRDPLTEPAAMADANRVRLVVKGGAVVKDVDGRAVRELASA